MKNTAIEFFAHQLSIDDPSLSQTVESLSYITDRKKVMEEFYEENHEKIRNILSHLKLNNPTAEELDQAIKEKVLVLDKQIFEALGKPSSKSTEGLKNLITETLALHQENQGFFFKETTAEKLLLDNPPKNVMREVGVSSVKDMLQKYDIFEIYACLRFVEDPEWLNATYLAAYRNLKKDDFEKRDVQIRVLEAEKWRSVSEKFVHKKRHPMSHLKELGLIFLEPSKELEETLTIYLFAMTSHYLDEILTYSKYFEYYSEKEDFGEKIVSAIRGHVPDISDWKGDFNKWFVVQRYLAKENAADPRLGIPHINPEALYHRGASRNLFSLSDVVPSLDFFIWQHSNYLGFWLPSERGGEYLVNFNLMDNVMSVMNKLDYKDWYPYHFHEALWNKIFINYFSVDKLRDVIIKYLYEGIFDVRKI